LQVTVHQLSKAYGFFWALRDLNFELSSAELVALLGPNGAGKTTFLKVLAGLIHPTAGKVEFDGEKLARLDSGRARVGFLAPGEHLYENLTARENLKFFTTLYEKVQPPADIDRALIDAGLGNRADDYVTVLSSGMKCRLAIAKWKLLEPELMLLDEPYGVLDGSGIDLLEDFLKSHCAKGHIAIVASHHVSRILRICTRAIVLHQGKVAFDEPRQQPWDSFARAFAEFLPHAD
jgi:heme exporter protein A